MRKGVSLSCEQEPYVRERKAYPFSAVPEDLVDVSRCRSPRHDGLHPCNDTTLIQRASHIRRAGRRQLRNPQPLGWIRVMHADDLVDGFLRVGLVHVQGDDGNLVDTARTIGEEVGQVAAPGEGNGRRDELRARGRLDEVLEGPCSVGSQRRGRVAHVAVVGFIEELEVGRRVGRCDERFGGGHVTRVHGDADLGRVDGARGGWVAVRRGLGERVDGEANCKTRVSMFRV